MTSMNKYELLAVENLHISYNGSEAPVEVLHGIQLNIMAGSSVGIVGESGSGKSQTALSIVRLIEGKPGITEGEIRFKERALTELTEKQLNQVRGHEIAIIFQDAKASLIPYMTIHEQVLDTHKSLSEGRGTGEMIRFARELLKKMNFQDPGRVLNSYPNQLSGGECQRAYVMLTLLGKPSLLIADEPSSSLDPVTSSQMLDLIQSLCKDLNITLILISHDLSEIARVTDYIYVMYDGHIVEEFPTSWLHDENHEPVHPYSRFLFSMFKGEAFASLRGQTSGENVKPVAEESVSENPGSGGCVYSSRCRLKTKLPSDLQKICRAEHPELMPTKEPAKAACWGIGEILENHADH